MLFGRADGWVSGRRGDQFSVTQKHLNITQRLACRGRGWGGTGETRKSKISPLTQSRKPPRILGFMECGQLGIKSRLCRWLVGQPVESLIRKIFKRI